MEGCLTFFTLAVALGNRYYLASLLLVVLWKFLREIGVGGTRGETQGKHLPKLQGTLPPTQHQLGWLRLKQ